MAKYSNTVEYNIRTTLDSSGIAKLQAELTQLQNKVNSMGAKGLLGPGATQKTLADIKQIQTALQQAFNPKLGMFNSSAFMKNVGMSMNDMYKTLSNIGPAGTQAFNSIYGQVAKIDTGMRSVSKTTDKIMNTFGNTVRWGLIASGFAAIMNSVHQAAEYVKDLDKSLTNIMMVSGETRDNMNEYARIANDVAQKLGSTTVAMTDATQVFIQQGYDLQKSQQLATYSTILGNISQQDTATASDEITAYMNAYEIPLESIGNALSKWAEVANVSAADVEELSVASQKAASVATTVGVDMDQLAATIATIETVTREAPENIGNGLKTIYSRLSDVKLGETLEDGVNLGRITSELEKVGVQVLDDAGKMRDVGTIVEDLMGVWETLDKTQKASVATTLAGRFQLARFEALMNRSDLYKEYLGASRNQTGTETLDFMQSTYEQSLEGRLNTLQAKVEEVFLNLFNSNSFNGAVDALSSLVDTINKLIEATGGGETALLGIVTVMTRLASSSMSRGIANFIQNRQADAAAQQNIEQARLFAQGQLLGQGLQTDNVRTNKLANNVASMNQYANIMNAEQMRQSQALLQQLVQTENQYAEAAGRATDIQNIFRIALSDTAGVGQMTAEQLGVLAQEMAAMTEQEILASDGFNQLRSIIQTTNTAFQNFAEVGQNATQVSLHQRQTAQALIDSFIGLRNNIELTETETKQFNSMLELLEKTARGDVQAFNQLGRSGFEQFAKSLDLSDTKLLKLVQDLGNARQAMAATDAQVTNITGQIQRISAGFNIQNTTGQIIGLTNSLMTAGFALMSFKGLIDVINNEDLTIAEKFEQFNMNLLMVAAMGIPAILQGKEALSGLILTLKTLDATRLSSIGISQAMATTGGIELAMHDQVALSIAKELQEQKQLTAEKYIAALMTEGYTKEKAEELAVTLGLVKAQNGSAAAGLKDTAIKGMRTVATKILTIALGEEAAAARVASLSSGALLGIFAAVAVAIGVITFAVQAVSKAEEERKKQLQASIDISNETVSSIKQHKSALDDLYNTYQQTGEVTKEFREALLEQAEALNIANAKTLVATGQYSTLKNKIDEATEAQLRYNNILLQRQNKDLKLPSSITINDAETERRMKQAGVNTQVTESSSEGGYSRSISSTDDSYTQLLKYEDTANQLIKKQTEIQNNITKLEKQKSIAESAHDENEIKRLQADIDKLTAEKRTVQDDIVWYQNQLSSEAGQQIMANGQQIVDNNIMLAQNDKAFQYTEGQSIDQYKAQIAEELRARGEAVSEEILNKYVEGIAAGDSKNAEALAAQKGYEDAKNAFQQNAASLMLKNQSAGYMDAMQTSDYVGYMRNVIENTGASNEDKMKLYNWIDWEGSQQEIFAQLDAIVANYTASDPLSVDQFLSKQGAEGFSPEELIDAMPTEDLDENVDPEQWKDLAKFIAETGDGLEGFSNDLLDNADASAEAAKEILRYDSALERAQKNMEDWQQMLESDAVEDHAKAASELKDIYGDLLDIDGSKLSAEFAADPQNLEDLQRVMEGDIEAYDRLADRAQKDIEIQAGIDATQAEADVARVNELFDSINFDDIEIGAHINDEGVYEALNNIVTSAGMTADEAQSLLASMGVDAELEPVTSEQQDTETYTDLVPTFGSVSETYTLPSGVSADGQIQTAPTTFTIPSVSWSATSNPVTSSKQVTGTAIKMTAQNGASSGGRVQIKPGTITKASSGGAKYRNASHGGGSKGGSSGGGGGGGGGGGSQAKAVKKAEGAKSKVDPYNKVNSELEKLADNYTEISDAQDRMYGDRYRRAAEKEIKNLQEQNEKLQERVEISEKLAEALRTGQDNPDYGIYLDNESLAKYGLTDTDLDGTVDNYIAIYNQALAAQNAAQKAADDYWASTGGQMTDEQSERYNELQEAQKEAAEYADKITDVVEKYQDTMDKIRDDTQQIQDNMYEIEDAVIDIWNYAKDAAKDLDEFREDQIDLAETLATLWGEDATKSLGFAFDRFTNMFENNEKALSDAIIDYRNRLSKTTDDDMKKWYQDQIDLAQQAILNGTSVLDLNMQRMQELFNALDQWKASGKSTLFGSNEQAMWEALDEAFEDATDYAKRLKDYIEDIHDNISDIIDEMNDEIDKRNDAFDRINDQYEYLRDMTELIYGEKAYREQEKLARAQAQAEEKRLQDLEKARDIQKDMLDSLQEGTEEYEQALENINDLEGQILDTRQQIADSYQETKELANEAAVQDWLDNFTADINGVAVPLEYAADQWERIKENADVYLDDLNRAWELEKLQNEYLKLIDDAIDPNLQRQITDQMEQQLDYLREKDKLSEYDVKYANAQLEILQKTIALEDARANKNQMKLRRDSQGNYSYVYAANRNDVRDRENELLDTRMNGYNMSVEASTDATDRYLQKVQSMADALRDAANDSTLSKEQVEAITQDIIASGYDFLDAMGEQLTTAQKNGIESYIQAARALSEANAGKVLDISQGLQDGIVDDLGMVTDVFNTAVLDWTEGPNGLAKFRDEADQTHEDVVRNIDDFIDAIGDANNNIASPLDDMESGFVDVNRALTDVTASAKDFYNFLDDKSGVIQRAAQDLAYYQNKLTDMNDDMNAYYTEWNNRGRELEAEKGINTQLRIDIENLQKEYEQKLKEAKEQQQKQAAGASAGNNSGYSDSDAAWGIAQNIWTYGSWGNDPYRHDRISQRYGEAVANLTQQYINQYWATGQLVNWASTAWGYASGGYTGSWGTADGLDGENGRLAFLHQKELVLNAEDTKNILAAVGMVRNLVDLAKGAATNINNPSYANASANNIGNNIEQRVAITAEFPNVESSKEIEEALLNLSNNAYQYAYNKNEKFF